MKQRRFNNLVSRIMLLLQFNYCTKVSSDIPLKSFDVWWRLNEREIHLKFNLFVSFSLRMYSCFYWGLHISANWFVYTRVKTDPSCIVLSLMELNHFFILLSIFVMMIWTIKTSFSCILCPPQFRFIVNSQ